MHMLLIVDGHFMRIEQFKRDLMGYTHVAGNRSPFSKYLYDEIRVSNIQLLDLSFPEECLEQLLYDLQIGEYEDINSCEWKGEIEKMLDEKIMDAYKRKNPNLSKKGEEEIKKLHVPDFGSKFSGASSLSRLKILRMRVLTWVLRQVLGLMEIPKVKLDSPPKDGIDPRKKLSGGSFLRWGISIFPLGLMKDKYIEDIEML